MRFGGSRILPILMVMIFLLGLSLNLPSVIAVSVFTSEPSNPVFPIRCGESSIIMDGEQLDCWFASGDTISAFGYDHLWYSYADKDDLGTFSSPVKVMDWSIRFPTVVEWNDMYYCFASKLIGGQDNIWLWNSSDKINWDEMNSGNPVVTLSADEDSQWHVMWNCGVVVVDDVFNMWVECANHTGAIAQNDVRLGYTHSFLADMDWDGNKTEDAIISMGGSPAPVYVGSQNAVMLFYSWLDTTWKLRVTTVNRTDELSDPDSYTDPFDLGVSDNGADPAFCEAGNTAEHNLVYQWFHGQPTYSDVYQEYSELSLHEFFGLVCGYTIGEGWMDNVGIHSVSFRNDGTIKYFANESDTVLGVYNDAIIDQVVVIFYSAYGSSYGANNENCFVSYYEPNSNELKSVVHYPDTAPIEYPWNGANVTVDLIYVNGSSYLEYTVYFNFTADVTLEIYGTYVFCVWMTAEYPAENFAEMWFVNLYRTLTPIPSGGEEAGITISDNVMFFAWLLIVFLPALLLNQVIPKIGFIAGIILMGIILMLVNAPPVPVWNFFMMMVGALILMFRGDD